MLQLKQKQINRLNRIVMTCAEANKIDLVEYLFSSGFTPTKIRGNDFWYVSPFRNENEASFKVNKIKNGWYDHGAGKGGDVVDFVTSYFSCNVSTALQKLSSFNHISQKQSISTELLNSIVFPEVSQPELYNQQITSEQQLEKGVDTVTQHKGRPPFHLHENSLINHKDAAETAIEIIAAKKPITDLMLCLYLKERSIDKNIADMYCYEVVFKFSNRDTKHIAIGFKNSAGGYELSSENFKLSSSPKYVTYITSNKQDNGTKTDVVDIQSNASDALKNEYGNHDKNFCNDLSIASQNDAAESNFKRDVKNKNKDYKQATKQLKSIAVFEGFFDFLTYRTIHQNQQQSLTDFLVLNSLAFFERSLLLMEKHEHIYLYLDHDEAGKKCLDIALKRSLKYKDESSLYNSYKDLNDWVTHFGKHQQKESLKVSNKNKLL